MGLVPAATWKIIFPAVFCLAKAVLERSTSPETMGEMTATLPGTISGDTRISKALQCMVDLDAVHTVAINSGGNVFTIIVVFTTPKKSTITTAQENTTNLPRMTMPFTVVDNSTTTDNDATTVNEPEGTIAGGDTTINNAASGVSSIAFEETTKNSLQNTINTASVENPYSTYTSTSGSGVATATNGDPMTDTENVIDFFEESSMNQDDVLLAENLGTTIPASTENTANTITGITVTQDQDNIVDMVTASGNAPEDLPDNTQVDPACYPECDIIPSWGTVLLCLGTAFFIFMLVGLLFLLQSSHGTPELDQDHSSGEGSFPTARSSDAPQLCRAVHPHDTLFSSFPGGNTSVPN